MHRSRFAALVAVALISFCSVASAADMPTKAIAYKALTTAPAPSWSGWYIGANAGWIGSASDPITNTSTDTGLGGLGHGQTIGKIPSSLNLNSSGFLGGGQVGYNWQAGNWVYGLEGDIQGANAKATVTSSSAPGLPGLPVATTYNRALDWLGTFRGRVGVTATPSLLLYGTGGLAVGRTKIGNQYICPACSPPSASEATTLNTSTHTSAGWTVGAGAEWMFAPKWSAKVEYLYVDLGNHTSTITYTYTPNISTLTSSARDTANIARGGINYHF